MDKLVELLHSHLPKDTIKSIDCAFEEVTLKVATDQWLQIALS